MIGFPYARELECALPAAQKRAAIVLVWDAPCAYAFEKLFRFKSAILLLCCCTAGAVLRSFRGVANGVLGASWVHRLRHSFEQKIHLFCFCHLASSSGI